MFIPLVDMLRCPNAHEETWLVASIERAEQRHIIEGMLGCPQCLAEYPVREGIVYFDEETQRAAYVPPDESEATRIAAALDLTDARMTAVLQGSWGAHAPLIRAIAPAMLILVNPPQGVDPGDGVSIIMARTPRFAQRSADGVAIDTGAETPMVHALGVALRGGRRVVAPAAMPVPPDLKELARDADVWVATLEASSVTSAPITPTRRPRTESR